MPEATETPETPEAAVRRSRDDPEPASAKSRIDPRGRGRTLGVIALGGMIGAVTRYAITIAFPLPAGAFAWPTLAVNVVGCLLIGVLMAVTDGMHTPRPLLRPFLGVGVLGGFTTFAAHITQAQHAFAGDAVAIGLSYLAVTLVACLLAVHLGDRLAHTLAEIRSRRANEIDET